MDSIGCDNPTASDDLRDQILTAVKKLPQFPAMGRAGRIRGTRELVVSGTPYIIPYRVKADRVEILSVMHGSRRWPDSF
ncbi:MAG TPA: type II toxin-antitoxin system RelE/ParE family toxin [Candidatus Koribacter sp.]